MPVTPGRPGPALGIDGYATDAETAAAVTAHVDDAHPLVLTEYTGNPILSPGVGDSYATFADVWFHTATYYAAVHVDDGIELFTSANGQTNWTSQGLILEPTPAAWDSSTVGVPSLWKEGSTWHMLYRGTGSQEAIGHATAATVTGPWTKNPANPVITGTNGQWDQGGAEAAPGQPIKVGSTYYVYYESRDSNRSIGVATSTDLTTWTKHASNPIMEGGRFCPCVWKDGDFYYYIGAHYTGTQLGSEIEMWRSRTPTFLPEEREYLGVVKPRGVTGEWDDYNLDTPTVLSDDINRDSRDVTDGALWVYYAGTGDGTNWYTGLLIGEPSPQRVEGIAEPFSIIGTWALPDLGANRAAAYIDLFGAATAVFKHVPFTRSGCVTGISIRSSEARTAGSCTATVVNTSGTSLGLSATLDGTNTTTHTAAAKPDTIAIQAGGGVGIALSSSSWGPTTADIVVTVEGILR